LYTLPGFMLYTCVMKRLVLAACIIASITVHAAIITYISAEYKLPEVSPAQGSPVIAISLTSLHENDNTGSKRSFVPGSAKKRRAIKSMAVDKAMSSINHKDHTTRVDKDSFAKKSDLHEPEQGGRQEAKKMPAGQRAIPSATGSIATARPVGTIKPIYPRYCRLHNQEGKVVLVAHVDASGRVTRVYIKQSSGISRLDKAAVDALRNARFKPATKAGIPVSSDIEETFIFRLKR